MVISLQTNWFYIFSNTFPNKHFIAFEFRVAVEELIPTKGISFRRFTDKILQSASEMLGFPAKMPILSTEIFLKGTNIVGCKIISMLARF